MGRGRYAAALGERVLYTGTHEPLFECARILQAEGANPLASIQMRWNSGAPSLAMSVGAAAKLTVHNNQLGRPCIAWWQPLRGKIQKETA